MSIRYWIGQRKKRIYYLVYMLVIFMFLTFAKHLIVASDKQERMLNQQLSRLNHLNIRIRAHRSKPSFKSSAMKQWQALGVGEQFVKKSKIRSFLQQSNELNSKAIKIKIQKHKGVEPSN